MIFPLQFQEKWPLKFYPVNHENFVGRENHYYPDNLLFGWYLLFHECLIEYIYRRLQNVTHPINKALHLAWKQRSERVKDEVSYFYVGDVFVYNLGLSMPFFKKKSLRKVPNFSL